MRWQQRESCPKPAPSSVACGVPAFSLERLRRLLRSPGNAPLAHSCFGLTPRGEAFDSQHRIQILQAQKNLLFSQPCQLWDEKQALMTVQCFRGATQIQRARRAGVLLAFVGAGRLTAAVSGPARPLSSVPLFVAGLPACDPVLWPKGGDVLMRRHCGANGGKGYSAFFPLRGWAISRQSRSPRARP